MCIRDSDDADLGQVADGMADALVAAVTAQPLPHDIAHLYLTDPIGTLGRIDGVMFSGGVAEYVYQREARDFGDLGPKLGRAVRARIENGALPWPVLPAGECIRATCLLYTSAHIMISGLRGIGLPAAYVSGYLRTLPRTDPTRLQGADAMHAWVLLWCGCLLYTSRCV